MIRIFRQAVACFFINQFSVKKDNHDIGIFEC